MPRVLEVLKYKIMSDGAADDSLDIRWPGSESYSNCILIQEQGAEGVCEIGWRQRHAPDVSTKAVHRQIIVACHAFQLNGAHLCTITGTFL